MSSLLSDKNRSCAITLVANSSSIDVVIKILRSVSSLASKGTGRQPYESSNKIVGCQLLMDAALLAATK